MSTTTKNTKKTSKASITKRRKSSSSSKRKNSKGEVSSLQSLTESNLEETSKESQVSSKKSLIDYQEEVTMIFFRSMLPIIIERWEVVTPETEEASISAESLKIDDIDDISETDLRALDLTTSGIVNSKIMESTEIVTVPSLQKTSLKGESSTRSSKITSNMDIMESGEALKTESSYMFTVDNIKVIFKNGNYYQGPIYRTLFHGTGKFVWNDGTQYEGEFRNGEITGRGILIYPDLSYYKGEFCKGILNGKGIKYIQSSAMLYNGEWKSGKKHGKGWLLYKPGVWYDGEWAEDFYEGYGMRRYDSHMSYKGHWLRGLQHGAGTMVWQNHDMYVGEWKDGLMNGYGEYTWKAILTRTLVFPIRNNFKGSWSQGMRDGAGIMDFGTEGGAKLAGVWQCDYKHGPGVFICGNGKSVEGDPLFVFDKPANTHSAHIYKTFFEPKKNEENDNTVENPLSNASNILNDAGEKCSKNLNELLNEMKETTGTTINMKSEPYQIVGIDMYALPEEIDIADYLTIIANYLEENKQLKPPEACKNLQTDDVHFTTTTDLGLWTSSIATGKKFVKIVETRLNPPKECEVENEPEFSPLLEEERFRGVVIRRMLPLQNVYKYYATLTLQKTINYNVVMVRLLLWQFFRDIGILHYNYSIDELDLLLNKNDACNLETEHYPFEKIYFWQFLHVIITLALHIYIVKLKIEIDPSEGILSGIFTKFLDEIVFPKFGKSRAYCLFEYRDMLPIKSAYLLYRSFGESKSAKVFLSKTCIRKNKIPPCYLTFQKDKIHKRLYGGINSASIGNNVIFIPGEEPIIPRSEDNVVPIIEDQQFQDNMIIFRLLGPKRVRKCLENVCPNIVKDGTIVNMDYPLSFIEFYDLLLRCAFVWVDKIKSRERRIELMKEVQIQSPPSQKKVNIKGKKK